MLVAMPYTDLPDNTFGKAPCSSIVTDIPSPLVSPFFMYMFPEFDS